MNAIVGADIIIQNYDLSTLVYFKDLLSFPNPEYHKKLALGKWVGNIQPVINLWQRRGADLIVPYGMIDKVREKTDKIFYGDIRDNPYIRYKSNISLYDYQERVVASAIAKGHGVIVAPCGSGKTQMALELCARIGKRALWITHTGELLKQSMERAKACFDGLSGDDYGTITEGKVDVGKAITFATVQTASRVNLHEYREYWDIVIVDECHKAVGTPTKLMMFWKVVSSLNAQYKYGITATPEREDGLSPCMYALLGEKACEVTKDDVKQNICPVIVNIQSTGFSPDIAKITGADGIIDHNKLMNEIVNDEKRNKIIIADAFMSEKPCMILTDRVAHAKMFSDALGERARVLAGNVNKKMRDTAKCDIEDGKADILIATYPIAKEGLDIPCLRSLILATPSKNETTIVQSCGRVARKAKGKQYGMIYDYADDSIIFRKAIKKRLSIYKKNDYKVMDYDVDKWGR
jgi:superfamily II DNA or RNA helicase